MQKNNTKDQKKSTVMVSQTKADLIGALSCNSVATNLDQSLAAMKKFRDVDLSYAPGSIQCKIVNGPGKSRILDAFEYEINESDRIAIEFDVVFLKRGEQWVEDGLRVPMRDLYIDSIEHAANSDEQGAYLLRGTCFANTNYDQVKAAETAKKGVTFDMYVFEIFYNIKPRNGLMFLVKA